MQRQFYAVISRKNIDPRNEERDHVLINDMKNNDVEFYLEKFLRN